MGQFKSTRKYIISLAISFAGLLFLFFFRSESTGLPFPKFRFALISKLHSVPTDLCSGRYIYTYDLPARFNSDLLRDCNTLNRWNDMCPFIANSGLGPPLNDSSRVLPEAGWYATNQFTLEIIFHNRMKQYRCRTTNSSIAAAIYVPLYAGLDIGRHLWGYNMSVRDSLSLDLVQWLKSRPEWSRNGGRDHFFVSGRITNDHRRPSEEEISWGNKLMLLPEIENFTLLAIESALHTTNEVAIPYPTYFHPSDERQVASWQETVRPMDRPWLFSFAGARRPQQTTSIRDHLIDQCTRSDECRLLQCGHGKNDCYSPTRIIKLFKHSKFCLQPTGDSFTRRSTFDSILSGCIPVFFNPNSAYTQYMWHFPKNYTEYSVFISEEEVREGKVSIEEVLLKYSKERVNEMRENVISMIPRIVYKDPRYEVESVRDAFDIAIDGVIERVKRFKAA
ncbi:xyloglucan galactosyltransferase KATAMARI1 [Carex littledalei]|uniref:Xyloglucan galactosyltransferase KATAMARI1 n=1 Tax=Carex littledalei TaxID=544730 RepID=A0A833QYQ5_9POAL|nr:xyloglucan galactosyltransferase KATAMARI1 [Carex littledalei]